MTASKASNRNRQKAASSPEQGSEKLAKRRLSASGPGQPPAPTARQALARRLEMVLASAPDEVVARALAEDDVGTLATLATEEAFGRELTAVERSRLRGVQYRKDLLERAGGTLSVGDAAGLLGVTPEAVRKAIRSGGLIAIRTARGLLLPAIQFHEGGELPGLRRVLRAMSVESPWLRLNWLLSPEPRLEDGRSPVEALREGRVHAVEQAAALYGEQGAA